VKNPVACARWLSGSDLIQFSISAFVVPSG